MLDFEKYKDLPIWTSSNKWTVNHIHEIKSTKDMIRSDDKFYPKELIENSAVGKFYVSDAASLYFGVHSTVRGAVDALVQYAYDLDTI